MEKEKIIVVFITRKNEDMIDGFNKTWVREFANIEKAKKGILKMTKYAWVEVEATDRTRARIEALESYEDGYINWGDEDFGIEEVKEVE